MTGIYGAGDNPVIDMVAPATLEGGLPMDRLDRRCRRLALRRRGRAATPLEAMIELYADRGDPGLALPKATDISTLLRRLEGDGRAFGQAGRPDRAGAVGFEKLPDVGGIARCEVRAPRRGARGRASGHWPPQAAG